jgi:hypothetical protein
MNFLYFITVLVCSIIRTQEGYRGMIPIEEREDIPQFVRSVILERQARHYASKTCWSFTKAAFGIILLYYLIYCIRWMIFG